MLIVLHGEDTFRSRLKLKEIEETYKVKHGKDFALEKFSLPEVSFPELKTALDSRSLFDDSKFVVLKNLSLARPDFLENLEEYLKRSECVKSKEVFLIIFDDASLSTDKKFNPILKSAYQEQEFKKLSNSEAVEWFFKFFQDMPVGKDRINKIVNLCGGDTWQVYNETLKLYTYKKGGRITEDDIKLFNIGTIESKIFSTTNSIFGGNKKEAFWNLYTHIVSEDPPQLLFSMLERQLRIISLIKEEKESNTNQFAIVKKLGLHPFVVKKTFPMADKFSWIKIKDLYARAESLEIKTKTGQIEPYLACELFSSAVLA